MLHETISLLNLAIQASCHPEEQVTWRQMGTQLVEHERTLRLLSDVGTNHEGAYEAVVSARLAHQRRHAMLVIEALSEAVEFLNSRSTPGTIENRCG